MPPRTPLFLLGAGLLSLSAVTLAQAATPPAPDGGPGRGAARQPLTRAALQTMLEQRFDAMDADRDGTLTAQERRTHMAARRTAHADAMFAALDADGDGAISRAEFDARRDRARRGPGRDHAPGAGDHARSFRAGHGRGMSPMFGAMRGAFGQDRDAAIPRAQFVEAGLSRFDRLDTDHDGVISRAERDAARAAMRDHRARALPPTPGQ